MKISTTEQRLCRRLCELPRYHANRFTPNAHNALLEALFSSLACFNVDYLRLLFPNGIPKNTGKPWSLREAQGAVEGAEYSPAARGKPCGHVFKGGDTRYRCRTCGTDDTCVLCSRCYEASDHTGHLVLVSVSPGSNGCCDCGDPEAWRVPVNCAIHSALPGHAQHASGEMSAAHGLPQELVESIRMTIARAFDYICDVMSCSPEQLRLPKTVEGIQHDEKVSRLTSRYYDDAERHEESPEFALVLWNDEKHTIIEVREQVARACKKPKDFGLKKAYETNDIGRSIIEHDRDIPSLLAKSKIIEQIKVTVTIRSSRDTFREQMCGTIIEWLQDIAGCSVGDDHDILRHTICEAMLKPWRTGSEAANAVIGGNGMDDQEREESAELRRLALAEVTQIPVQAFVIAEEANDIEDEPNNSSDGEENGEDDVMDVDAARVSAAADADGDLEMENAGELADETEVAEATYAGYPPPPPPPPPHPSARHRNPAQPGSFSAGITLGSPSRTSPAQSGVHGSRRSLAKVAKPSSLKPPEYWLGKPTGYHWSRSEPPIEEDLSKRVRLDWLILFDLRMWKKARNDLRDLYITTVVSIPHFKRILGLRFAGLYTTLAQLYLIADREPDHSIINLSLQMLTTPSITDEVVEKGNFLTSLMAILYTFLTTRQVGRPEDVNPMATLAFDAGSLTNRRMYHLFADLCYLLVSERVQQKLRSEPRYLSQFLDLVKLHQGICPNVRAVGEHVEYETDAWISASLITRELNRVCRLFAQAFTWTRVQDDTNIRRAVREVALVTIRNSLGLERFRFGQAEIKEETRFRRLGGFEFDTDALGNPKEYLVVNFVVEKQHISFHHALHYALSWLIDCAKSMPSQTLRELVQFSKVDVYEQAPSPDPQALTSDTLLPANSEDYLLAMFDFPLRVCVWLSQMKAGMWVRNGLSLKHQMSTYRGVSQRDVAYHRDIFMLQAAMVICDPSRVLASMIDRFGMDQFVDGVYTIRGGFDDNQLIDVAEDFLHLMIIILCDRLSLLPVEDESQAQALLIKKEIAHILCFKPLAFSDLANRLPDRLQDLEEFQDILDEMTTYRSPEGLSDTGTFELKGEYLENVDPYAAQYNRNQREECENVYRAYKAKMTRVPEADVVYEPSLRHIQSGAFTDLSAFTRTSLFVQVIYYSLAYPLRVPSQKKSPPPTMRLETFLQVALHLTLLATLEDTSDEVHMAKSGAKSFVDHAIMKTSFEAPPDEDNIVSLLQKLLTIEEYMACHSKAKLILRRMQQRRPRAFESVLSASALPVDRMGTASPANSGRDDAEAKKKLALERKALVMAQFQQQQQSFLERQGDIDWGENDMSESESDGTPVDRHKKVWKYATGTCILCQEETSDSKLYGTFAFIGESNILRQTDLGDPDWASEAANVPSSLDRSAEGIRPFGVSGKNIEIVHKLNSKGEDCIAQRRGLGKGFPSEEVIHGPVTTGCGHIMHYICFELYYQATERRHANQISRAHAERLTQKEFICPLCKALGNMFLPIIWKGKEEIYPGVLQTADTFDDWFTARIGPIVSRFEKAVEGGSREERAVARYDDLFTNYIRNSITVPYARVAVNSAPPYQSQTAEVVIRSIAGAMNVVVTSPTRMSGPASASAFSHHVARIELKRVYERVRDTLNANDLGSRYLQDAASIGVSDDLIYIDTLARSLGYSISAVEIAQRGVQSDPGTILVANLPQQSLTTLRVLSETVSSYIAVGAFRKGSQNKTVSEFADMHRSQLRQLFIGHPQIFDPRSFPLEVERLQPLLSQEMFVFLSECSTCLVPALNLDMHHTLRLCYIAEMVKVVLGQIPHDFLVRGRSWPLSVDNEPQYSRDQLTVFENFVNRVLEMHEEARSMQGNRAVQRQTSGFHPAAIRRLRLLAANYALPFLRKSAILLHVRYGVDFPNTGFVDLDEPELDRLTKALRLPSLDEIFGFFCSFDYAATTLQCVVAGWIRHWMWFHLNDSYQQGLHTANGLMRLSHPGIFELVALPTNFDVLSEEAMKKRCPNTGKELVDPSICLFCGDIFCSQALCCSKEDDRLGGCNQHMFK